MGWDEILVLVRKLTFVGVVLKNGRVAIITRGRFAGKKVNYHYSHQYPSP